MWHQVRKGWRKGALLWTSFVYIRGGYRFRGRSKICLKGKDYLLLCCTYHWGMSSCNMSGLDLLTWVAVCLGDRKCLQHNYCHLFYSLEKHFKIQGHLAAKIKWYGMVHHIFCENKWNTLSEISISKVSTHPTHENNARFPEAVRFAPWRSYQECRSITLPAPLSICSKLDDTSG